MLKPALINKEPGHNKFLVFDKYGLSCSEFRITDGDNMSSSVE